MWPMPSGRPGCVRSSARNLRLLVATQDEGLLRRVEIQPHDVPELRLELRIVGELESPPQVRLQSVTPPDAAHAGGRNPKLGRGRPRAAPSRARRPPACLADDLLDDFRRDRRLATATGTIHQPVESLPFESLRPLVDRCRRRAHLVRHVRLLHALRPQQHDARTQAVTRRCRARANTSFEFRFLFRRQFRNGDRSCHGHSPARLASTQI